MTPPPAQEQNVTQGNTASKRSARDFIFGKVIGEGSFSTVYLAKDIHTHKEYASKLFGLRKHALSSLEICINHI